LWDQGRLTRFDVPNSVATAAFGINDKGQITGGYADEAGSGHGFLLEDGRYTTIDVPGRPEGTTAWGINDRGEIVIPDVDTGLGTVTL
jgi:probable HAF family extracellular repeat protein